MKVISKKFLREPLVHFLLIGIGLFVLFYSIADPTTDRPNHIVVTAADVDRLANMWAMRWQRPPTPKELEGMIEDYIREEVLYREAVALGLEKNDAIVRRRMAQKIEFMFKDLIEQKEPTDAELSAYLKENEERFREPAQVTFSHVYFNSDERGRRATADAKRLLVELRARSDTVDAAELGDRIMLDSHYAASETQIARLFGTSFATEVVQTEPGAWRGPLKSGYGVHLVFVKERRDPRVPSLAEIRDKIRWEYLVEHRVKANESFYRELRQRYDVTIESHSRGSGKMALDLQ